MLLLLMRRSSEQFGNYWVALEESDYEVKMRIELFVGLVSLGPNFDRLVGLLGLRLRISS
jgi:hypothetical protein